jgi:hypothetical protein
VSPPGAPAGSSSIVTIVGSGFQTGASVTLGGKPAAASFVDVNTLKFSVPPGQIPGPQHLTISVPDGETISVDGLFRVN